MGIRQHFTWVSLLLALSISACTQLPLLGDPVGPPTPTPVPNLTWEVSTVAGTGTGGFDGTGYADGVGRSARFNVLDGITVDADGNLYVTDTGNSRIRKISPSGEVTTVAGDGIEGYADGVGTSARFNRPVGITVDTHGNLYVTDTGNFLIRKISPSGTVTRVAGDGIRGYADGGGTSARFNTPMGITVDADGNLYVTDTDNHCIRKISPSGAVTTVAGNGTVGYADGVGTSARFNRPVGITVDADGNLYVTDYLNSCIRKIRPSGQVTTVAGPGRGITVDVDGNLYVTDTGNFLIRKISPSGEDSTLVGDGTRGFADGVGTSARFNRPLGITVDAGGNLYVTDFDCIRKINH